MSTSRYVLAHKILGGWIYLLTEYDAADLSERSDNLPLYAETGNRHIHQLDEVSASVLPRKPRSSPQLSTGCSRPRPGFAFYNASKAAVHVGRNQNENIPETELTQTNTGGHENHGVGVCSNNSLQLHLPGSGGDINVSVRTQRSQFDLTMTSGKFG